MNVTTTLSRHRAPGPRQNVNSIQNATYCSLKHHSKRETSLSVIVGKIVTGYPALLDRVWTSEVSHEHIVVEIQVICEEKTNREYS
jgi:hypothetical protein